MMSLSSMLTVGLGILVCYNFGLTGGTECYKCDSWMDSGCLEDYIVNVNLTICGHLPPSSSSFWRGTGNLVDMQERARDIAVISTIPRQCFKEVTMFLDQPKYDPDNRYTRPLVRRGCGYTIQQGYRAGRDLIDDCEETEVVVQGNRGIKRTCFCSTDGCNTATTLKSTGKIGFVFGLVAIYFYAANQ